MCALAVLVLSPVSCLLGVWEWDMLLQSQYSPNSTSTLQLKTVSWQIIAVCMSEITQTHVAPQQQEL